MKKVLLITLVLLLAAGMVFAGGSKEKGEGDGANGGKQFIEETNDGDYADKRVKELNKRIDSHHKNRPNSYSLETI